MAQNNPMLRFKRSLFLIILSLFYLHSFSQRASLDWVDMAQKTKYVPTVFRVVKGQQDDLIIFGIETQTRTAIVPVLIRLDKELNKVAEKELPTSDSNVSFHSICNIKGQVFLYTCRYNPEKRNSTLYSTQVNPLSLEVGTAREIGVFEWQPEIVIKPSADSSVVLIYAKAPDQKGKNGTYYVSVWDNKMNKQWERPVTLPYADDAVSVEGFEISNDGDVFIKCRHYDGQINNDQVRLNPEKIPAYKYKLLAYRKNETAFSEYVIGVENKFVHDVVLQFDAGDNINLLGLYKNKFDGKVNGSFSAVLNTKTGDIRVKKLDVFPVDGLLDLLDMDDVASSGSKDAGLKGNFRIIGVNRRNDGSVDLLTEYNYWFMPQNANVKPNYATLYNQPQRDYTPPPIYNSTPLPNVRVDGGFSELKAALETYDRNVQNNKIQSETIARLREASRGNNNESIVNKMPAAASVQYATHIASDIVVVNFKNDSEIVYTRVPKDQREAITNEHISFKWMNRGDKLLLFYNDARENIEKDLSKKPDDLNDLPQSAFIMATVDGDGLLQRKVLYNHSDLGMVTMIRASGSIAPDAFILYAGEMDARQAFRFGCFRLR
jgi:hypothetical protein